MKESIGRQWIHSESSDQELHNIKNAQQLPLLWLLVCFLFMDISFELIMSKKKKKKFCLCYRIFAFLLLLCILIKSPACRFFFLSFWNLFASGAQNVEYRNVEDRPLLPARPATDC